MNKNKLLKEVEIEVKHYITVKVGDVVTIKEEDIDEQYTSYIDMYKIMEFNHFEGRNLSYIENRLYKVIAISKHRDSNNYCIGIEDMLGNQYVVADNALTLIKSV